MRYMLKLMLLLIFGNVHSTVLAMIMVIFWYYDTDKDFVLTTHFKYEPKNQFDQ